MKCDATMIVHVYEFSCYFFKLYTIYLVNQMIIDLSLNETTKATVDLHFVAMTIITAARKKETNLT